MSREPTIIPMGGGGFSMAPENLALDRYILSHAGVPRPKVSFLPTASGDSEGYIDAFYAAYGTLDCDPSHVSLFRRNVGNLRDHVLSQDVIYVGGGNCWNMLLLWQAHGLDAILREACEAGVILCGLSAGSICWFEQGTTDSFGLPLQPLTNGLGLLSGSHCPHYDGEDYRRPTYLKMVGDGTLLDGIALDDYVGVRYVNAKPVEYVASNPGAQAYSVVRSKEGAVEKAIQPTMLSM